MRRFRQLVPREFWLAMLTLLGVIVLDVLPALILGVVGALLLLIYRASRPQISMLGADPVASGVFTDITRHHGVTTVPGVLIVRPDAPLFYAEELGKLAGNLSGRDVALGLAHVHGPALTMAERSGLLAAVGADHVFPTTPAAVSWARSVAGSTGITRRG